MTDVYLTNGRRLQITIDSKNRIKLKILIEKAINCVGCGACLSLCKFDALHIENGSVCVDPSKCTHCKKCITSTDKLLRGGCIVRNYSIKKATLLKENSTPSNNEFDMERRPCVTEIDGKNIKTCDLFGHFYNKNNTCYRCGHKKETPILGQIS